MPRLLLSSGLLAVGFGLLAQAESQIPVVWVDLHQDARTRWSSACSALLTTPERTSSFADVVVGGLADFARVGCGRACVDRLASSVRSRWPQRHRELRGIADCARASGEPRLANLTADDLSAVAFMYELSHVSAPGRAAPAVFGCTSVAVCDELGWVLHGRNLDWTPVGPYANVTAAFVHGDAFTSVDFLMDAGTVTGVAPGLSVSLNYRSGSMSIEALLRCVESGRTLAPVRYAIREALESGMTFRQAVSRFSRSDFCAPFYLVLAGDQPGQGVVLTKSAAGAPAPENPRQWLQCAPDSKQWFVAQTNYDSWKRQPASDDRLGLATQALVSAGRDASTTVAGMWDVLSVQRKSVCKGVCNAGTVFTTVLDPVSGTVLFAALRSCPR
eukprot:m51a1_g525 hypothetical protein (387) ;mRNA; r:360383-361543